MKAAYMPYRPRTLLKLLWRLASVETDVFDVRVCESFGYFKVLGVEDDRILKLSSVREAHVDALIPHARLRFSSQEIDPPLCELDAHVVSQESCQEATSRCSPWCHS